MGAAFIVVTDDDAARAQQLADALSDEMFERRDEFMPELLAPAEAVDQALAEGDANTKKILADSINHAFG